MKSSEYLEQAAKMLQSRRAFYVCHALEHIDKSATMHIRNRIVKSLSGQTVLEWLWRQGYAKDSGWSSAPIIRDYKARWCRWMAEGYRAKGD